MARGSMVNLAAMVTGALLTFGLTVLVSRWLQPAGAGAFFELIALFTIASNTLELGADTGLSAGYRGRAPSAAWPRCAGSW